MATVTKATLLKENDQLRSLLAAEIADRQAIQSRLNELLANRHRTTMVPLPDSFATFTMASDYARQFGGVVRRDARDVKRFIVVGAKVA